MVGNPDDELPGLHGPPREHEDECWQLFLRLMELHEEAHVLVKAALNESMCGKAPNPELLSSYKSKIGEADAIQTRINRMLTRTKRLRVVDWKDPEG